MVRSDLVHHPDVGLSSAFLVSAMLNLAKMSSADSDGWFTATSEDLEDHTAFPRSTQWRLLEGLVKLGLVETRVVLGEKVRQVRINPTRLVEVIGEGRRVRIGRSSVMSQNETNPCLKMRHLYKREKTEAKKHCGSRARREHGVEEPEVLFDPEQGRTKDSPITRFDLDTAKTLKEGITKRYGRAFSYRQEGWADQIRRLRKSLTDNPEDRITKVVNWLATIPREAYPYVGSAEGLRKVFDRAESTMLQAKKKRMAKEVEVSPRSMEIADRLTKYTPWPKGSAGQVPQVVEQSIRNVRAVVKRCRTLVESGRPTDQKDLVGMAKLILDWIRVTSPESRVEIHLERVSDQVTGWEGWSGNLCPFVWRLDQKTILQQVMVMGTEYCGSAKFTKWWDSVKDELLEGL